jgi:hypothetical protein
VVKRIWQGENHGLFGTTSGIHFFHLDGLLFQRHTHTSAILACVVLSFIFTTPHLSALVLLLVLGLGLVINQQFRLPHHTSMYTADTPSVCILCAHCVLNLVCYSIIINTLLYTALAFLLN